LVAVTGATGFLGSQLIHCLAAGPDWTIRILARRMPTAALTPAARLQVVLGNLNDPESLRRLVSGADVVVHVAGIVKARHAAAFRSVNVGGTENLAAAVVAAAPEARVVHVSSLAAREPRLSPYAASKHAAEEIMAGLASRRAVTIVRPPAIYGPGDPEILPMFQLAARGLGPFPAARGARLSLIHVADAASAIAAVAAEATLPDFTYEIDDGYPGGYSWSDLMAALSAAVARPIKTMRLPRPLMAGVALGAELQRRIGGRVSALCLAKLPELYHPDWVARGPRLSDRIGWRPRFLVDAGFRDALAWYRAENWLKSGKG
jgi:nucleoside-diphosphate-sugar epimerase